MSDAAGEASHETKGDPVHFRRPCPRCGVVTWWSHHGCTACRAADSAEDESYETGWRDGW